MTTINVDFWLDFLLSLSGGFSLSIALWFQLVSDRDIHPSYIAILAFIGAIILLAVIPAYVGLGEGPLFAIKLVIVIAIMCFDVGMAWWLQTSASALHSPSQIN